MISKELLSEVLNISINLIELNPILENNKNDIGYLLKGSQNTVHEVHRNHKRINIYELAHKCKEWALKHGYLLESGLAVCFEKGFCEIYTTRKPYQKINEVLHNTEPEAIFKACEWVMTNQ